MDQTIFYDAIEISIFGYFFYTTLYNLILSVSGHFSKSELFLNFDDHKRIVVFIPCYKEDSIIIDTVERALETDYPAELFKVVVIADSFCSETLSFLASFPIEVVEVSFKRSTKVKAINLGLEKIKFEAEVMVVLDADNVMESQFLWKINSLFNREHKVVQGRREIKNQQNDLTYLDDLSEQINNHINRKGSCNLGGSSSISGSGFAVDYNLGERVFKSIDSVGGFDKDFELELLKYGYKTRYFEDIVIFDEKVKTDVDFENQRTRWIASQYHFLFKNFTTGIKALFSGDFALFNSLILRNLQLPRLINTGLLTLFVTFVLIEQNLVMVPFQIWLIMYIAFLISILLAIPKEYYSLKLVKVITRLPGIFIIMLKIMFKLKGANRNFIHTPHYKNPRGDE